ncbi:MAG TPA: hypothetical protein VKZ62_00065 [Georgenia sp.]|nr:hypothetical protein [Georgenia sp.]
MPTSLKSPQQQIYDAVFLISTNLGYATFDYLPANQVAYPFVFVGEQSDQDLRTKSGLYGNVQQTIHIYHSYRRRRELTNMMNALKLECRKLKRTENFYVVCKNINGQVMLDNSTSEPILHGIIEIEFTFH